MRLVGVLALCLSLSSGCSLFKNNSKRHASLGLNIYLQPNLDKFGPFSHVCQMSDGKRYLAVLGAKFGTIFVDYTDNKLEKGDLLFFRGAPSQWRECRTYNDPKTGNVYAYVVTEGDNKIQMVNGQPDFSGFPGGIQIFKMTEKSVAHVSTYVGNFNTAHTITIDAGRGLAFLNGSSWKSPGAKEHKEHKDHLGGLRILDIGTDPENPIDLGGYTESYTHDSYSLGEVTLPRRLKFNRETGEYVQIPEEKINVLYLADIFEGYIRALDVTDPKNPKLINSVHTPMHNQGISAHNVWASEDKKWLFATEETRGSSLLIYDISFAAKPRFITAYKSDKVHNDSVIHNVVVKGNIAYCSWYKEGVRLVDISDPFHPKEIAFFDSSVVKFNEKELFHGNWSVDVDDRGLIMISDIEEGLFILKRTI